MTESLDRFVHEALNRGLGKEEIRAKLREAGWGEDEISSALDAWADIDSPLPVPRPRPYLSAREAFVYLVLFSALYLSAISLGQLLFQFIGLAFPDPATGQLWERSARSVRWASSSLLIGFPVFLLLSRSTYRAIRRDPKRRSSKIRKWLTYLTLFVAAAVLIGDLITLVFNVLGGEFTVRFVLKVLATGAIAGTVFGYYLWELRQDDSEPEELVAPHPGVRVLASVVIGVVGVALIAGLIIAGTPATARAERLDDRRQSDLASIAAGIDYYWRNHERLPASLEELAEDRYWFGTIADPVTLKPYEYRVMGDRRYELCAVFETIEESSGRRDGGRFWDHRAGRVCFDVSVRPSG